ncbi:hypothetical protein ACS0TY_023354 [Phlomoides rotata]
MMQVIMRRAERKLQLSRNVIGDEIMDQDGGNVGGTEAGDLKFVVFGLHVFDQVEMNDESKKNQMINFIWANCQFNRKVIASHRELQSEEGDRKFEINLIDWMNGQDIVMQDMMSDSGSVHFVYGDCTNTAVVSHSEATIIFSCVDNSGNWGHGGMFDALARLSAAVPNAYERALKFGDLHPGDLHLIETTGQF